MASSSVQEFVPVVMVCVVELTVTELLLIEAKKADSKLDNCVGVIVMPAFKTPNIFVPSVAKEAVTPPAECVDVTNADG